MAWEMYYAVGISLLFVLFADFFYNCSLVAYVLHTVLVIVSLASDKQGSVIDMLNDWNFVSIHPVIFLLLR